MAAAGARLFVSTAAAQAAATRENEAASTDLIDSLVRSRLVAIELQPLSPCQHTCQCFILHRLKHQTSNALRAALGLAIKQLLSSLILTHTTLCAWR